MDQEGKCSMRRNRGKKETVTSFLKSYDLSTGQVRGVESKARQYCDLCVVLCGEV